MDRNCGASAKESAMGCLNSTSASADKATIEDLQLYYDPAQELIAFDPNYEHIAANELKFISEHDQVMMRAGDECYVISVAWLSLWMEYVKGNRAPPKGIDNKVLIDAQNSRKLRRTIVSKKDYRPVCKAVWEFYFVAYGGGPVILFHGTDSVVTPSSSSPFSVPSGLDEKLYKTGEWLKFVKLEEIVSIVSHFSLPLSSHLAGVSRSDCGPHQFLLCLQPDECVGVCCSRQHRNRRVSDDERLGQE